MTRIEEAVERTAAMKIAKKALLGEISDYPEKIGQYKLVETDGIKAVYVNKKGQPENVRLTDDIFRAAHRYLVADGLLPDVFLGVSIDKFMPTRRERLAGIAASRKEYAEAREAWQQRRWEQ